MNRKMSLFRAFRLMIAVALASCLATFGGMRAEAEPARVQAVRTTDSLGLQIAIDLEKRLDPLVFVLDEPMRLVIDLADGRWALAQGAAPNGAVAGWRYGRKDAAVARLVIDLAMPVQVKRVSYDLGAPRGTSRLLVDLEPTSRAVFHANAQSWIGTSDLLRNVYTPPEPQIVRPPPRPAAEPAPAVVGAAPAANPPPIASAPTEIAPKPVPRDASPPSAAPPPETVPAAQAPNLGRGAGRPAPLLRPPARRIVVLDPGHGGQDPGAIGVNGTYEKTITLAVAREAKRQLEVTGRYRVHLTRDRDEFLRLRERVQRARNFKAELFISIHADSIGSSDTRGASVYTLSDTSSDAEAAALAARENRADIIAGVDLTQESREVANILIDLAQRETMNRSAGFAYVLVRELGREIRIIPVSPHRFAGFAVLKAPDVPAVLLELGYLSNRQDEALLKQGEHRRRVGQALQRAVDAFFAAAAR